MPTAPAGGGTPFSALESAMAEHQAAATASAATRPPKGPPPSEGSLRTRALLDVERGHDALLRYPPMDHDCAAAEAHARRAAQADGPEACATVKRFFARYGGCTVGRLLAELLALASPGQRPQWLVLQIERWLQLLSYMEPSARRATSRRLAQLCEVSVARPGELIERQGERAGACRVLLSGQCSVHLNLLNEVVPRYRPGGTPMVIEAASSEAAVALVALPL